MQTIKSKEITRLLINQPAFIGDAVMTTPLAAAARKEMPHAEIDMLCIPGTKAVWRYNPNIDDVLLFDKKNGGLKKVISFFRLLRQLRRKKYDCVLSVQQSITSSLLFYLAGIKYRVGLSRQKMMTHSLKIPKGLHVRNRNLALMKVFSAENYRDETEMFWSEDDERVAKNRFEEAKGDGYFLIAIAPGSVWATKRWPELYWAELIAGLYREGISAVLLGSKDDRDLCSRIVRKSGGHGLNLCGELSINRSAALIAKCDLAITNDSAPMHFANAVDTPVFAFFGPTVKRFGCYPYREKDRMLEYEIDCRPCGTHGHMRCPNTHFKCMLEQKPEMIKEKILGVLFKN